MRPTKTVSVGVVREAEQRHVRKVLRDVVRVDPRDVHDHEIGRIHAFHRDEPVARKKSLQLAAEKEVDPHKQDRRHAYIRA